MSSALCTLFYLSIETALLYRRENQSNCPKSCGKYKWQSWNSYPGFLTAVVKALKRKVPSTEIFFFFFGNSELGMMLIINTHIALKTVPVDSKCFTFFTSFNAYNSL